MFELFLKTGFVEGSVYSRKRCLPALPQRVNPAGWLTLVCSVLVFSAGCASSLVSRPSSIVSQNSVVSSQPSQVSGLEAGVGDQTSERDEGQGTMDDGWLESAKADLKNWPDRIVEDSKYTFLQKDNMILLALAGGASIAMHNTEADDNIWENCQRHQVFHDFIDKSLYTIGDPPTHFAATALWYALAAENQDGFNKERAWTMMTALAIDGLVTTGLKAIRDNETPNGRSWAWPSGHTSSSFTVASVLNEFYGPKVGIPAFVAASVVAYRMMDTGDHWASDCVFGATLGWVVGHSVAGKHKQLEVAGFEVLPYTALTKNDNTAMGICLVKQF